MMCSIQKSLRTVHATDTIIYTDTEWFTSMDTTREAHAAAEDAKKQTSESRGFFSDLVLNAFEPGVNSSVLVFLNVVFFLLLATLVAVTFVTGINVHIIFLGIIALGLMIGFNLYVYGSFHHVSVISMLLTNYAITYLLCVYKCLSLIHI